MSNKKRDMKKIAIRIGCAILAVIFVIGVAATLIGSLIK